MKIQPKNTLLSVRLRKVFIALCLLCAPSVFLSAQSAALELGAIMASDTVTYAQASRFVLEAADAATFADPVQAFNFAVEQNWLPANILPGSPARLDHVSLLLMRSFDLTGGIMFTLTGGTPHFAYREMEHRGFIHGRASPRQLVSGEMLLYMTGRILTGEEERLGITAEHEFIIILED
jgi:hypothetical protein